MVLGIYQKSIATLCVLFIIIIGIIQLQLVYTI